MEHALTSDGHRERRRLPGPDRPPVDRGAGPGRRRTLRGTAPPDPGRLPPQTPARPAAPGNLRHRGPVRTPGHRDEHRHQPPHRPRHRQGTATGQHGAGRTGRRVRRRPDAPGPSDGARHGRRGRRSCRPWTSAPGRNGCSTAWSVPAKRPSPPEGCPPPAGSGPRSWPPSTTGTCSPGSGDSDSGSEHSTGPEPGDRSLMFTGPVTAVHGAQNRLRRRHHPGRPRRRGPGPGHRPRLPGLPAPHPQGHHGPGPGLRLPAMHDPGPLVRGPPHHLLVPRRNHRNRTTEPCSAPITTT